MAVPRWQEALYRLENGRMEVYDNVPPLLQLRERSRQIKSDKSRHSQELNVNARERREKAPACELRALSLPRAQEPRTLY